MSLVSAIQSAIDDAFNALGDLVGSFTLRRRTSTFNPLTSDYSEVVTDYIGTGFIDKDFKDSYGNQSSERRTIESSIHGTTIETGNTVLWLKISQEPKVSDFIVMPDSVERVIVKVTPIKTYNTAFMYEIELAS